MKFPTLALAAALALTACTPYIWSPNTVLAPKFVVSNVDPAALSGTWHQMASFPQAWEEGCSSVTWEFLPWFNDTAKVVGRCTERATGAVRQIQGDAIVHDGRRVRVRVSDVRYTGDFWVLDLAPDGRSVTVGNDERIAGWVMTRDPGFNRVAFDRAVEAFQRSGYDAAALQRTR